MLYGNVRIRAVERDIATKILQHTRQVHSRSMMIDELEVSFSHMGHTLTLEKSNMTRWMQ